MPVVIAKQRSEFIKFLVAENLVTSDQLVKAEKDSEQAGVLIEQWLVSQKLVEESELAKMKARFFGLGFVDLIGRTLDASVLKIIPKAVAEHYEVIAFDRDAVELKVAIVDPRNFQAMAALDVLSSEEKLHIRYYITSTTGFDFALKKYEELKGEVAEVLKVVKKEETIEKLTAPVEEVIKGAPVSRIVAVIMRHAYDGHASDIHIEPTREGSQIRYRIDGVLQISLNLPPELHDPVIARVKVLANLKLDETRIPQDGRITETIGGKPIDFRVSTLPLQEGKEKVVIRILAAESAPTLVELGFNPEHIKIIERCIKRPHGLILISGPTGAGKSTTLYAILSILNQEGINIVTLEDPIEYFITGVNQSQVRPEVGYSFASGLRAILRQDPNIIMVGEIRDSETAELSVHAALTGHLLLSTIHTNDAMGVIPRLIDLGVEPFLLGSTFAIAIAQRLARKICQDCRVKADLPVNVVEQMKKELSGVAKKYLPGNIDVSANLTFYRGQGCPRCGKSGYKGRVAVVEVIESTREIEKLINNGFPTDKVEEQLRNQEVITMKQDALIKALRGLTTVEEVLRISKE